MANRVRIERDRSAPCGVILLSNAAQSELFDKIPKAIRLKVNKCRAVHENHVRSPQWSSLALGMEPMITESAIEIEDQRVVGRGLFDAMCAQFPDKYIALISTSRV